MHPFVRRFKKQNRKAFSMSKKKRQIQNFLESITFREPRTRSFMMEVVTFKVVDHKSTNPLWCRIKEGGNKYRAVEWRKNLIQCTAWLKCHKEKIKINFGSGSAFSKSATLCRYHCNGAIIDVMWRGERTPKLNGTTLQNSVILWRLYHIEWILLRYFDFSIDACSCT